MISKLKRFTLRIILPILALLVGVVVFHFYCIKPTADSLKEYLLAHKRAQIEAVKEDKKASNNSKKQANRKPQDPAYPEAPKKSSSLDDSSQKLSHHQTNLEKNGRYR